MSKHKIIVIGGSAGSVVPLLQLINRLPPDLPATIFIVVHGPATKPDNLPQILQRYGQLPAVHAVDGAAITPGYIYVAPPDYHLLVERNYMRVVMTPKENGFRPAIDPLFRTAANAYRKWTIGVVLSGALADGTAGLMEVKKQGGLAIVQDPQEALIPSMPQSAIEHVAVDYILPIANMASILVDLTFYGK